MERRKAYEWGRLFASPWDDVVRAMSRKAAEAGLTQRAGDHHLDWMQDGDTRIRYCFVDDPSDIESIRKVYNDDTLLQVPVCFVVVKQPDPSEKRGDIVFDIFRLSAESYLWHFNRVYTPPRSE